MRYSLRPQPSVLGGRPAVQARRTGANYTTAATSPQEENRAVQVIAELFCTTMLWHQAWIQTLKCVGNSFKNNTTTIRREGIVHYRYNRRLSAG
ncbi:Uncharacterized protein AC514_1022 [Pseudomonas savastanoi pv. phaseolicola]|uniref:Uncharacterized protein n=1 Tax=Pseudomonas savastanoi pv. glycinea TaxID=318 RepID=A0A3M3F480_PSESG|nr:Uncharacterized protein AC514_1022 [Pseudomonas savastanoi pv. phaseolicola]KPB57558.1 Uncharacterized protein AC508_3966 [Pseudomonas amygdali pv. mellea]RMM56681.1 hypothetical protein ALQ74_103217 [Pseudomonas savastanoi pv. glycinea]KPB38786.1 Uncharacterized protein AC513_3246 [Pseudomonas savastanoi pv. phaseolicola]KPB57926.1 Uncharacterized protein AC512_0370 [Pseudomonas savastanoi pv. phaseolicola]